MLTVEVTKIDILYDLCVRRMFGNVSSRQTTSSDLLAFKINLTATPTTRLSYFIRPLNTQNVFLRLCRIQIKFTGEIPLKSDPLPLYGVFEKSGNGLMTVYV